MTVAAKDGFDDLPDWATKLNFTAHSPSGTTRPDSKEFFEKAIARPARLRDLVGCTATAGTAVHNYVTDIIAKEATQAEAFRAARATLDEHLVLEHVDGDAEKLNTIRDSIYEVPNPPGTDKKTPKRAGTVFELTCEHMLQGVREATASSNVVDEGKWASVQFDGLQLPFIGQLDLQDRGVVEMKTKWPSMDMSVKRGWKINSLPSHPAPEHIMQVAFYWHWLKQQSKNVPVRLVYANCRGFRIFSSEEGHELSEARFSEALDRMRTTARAREKLMRAACREAAANGTSPRQELFQMIAPPDPSHFMWKNVPAEYREEAEKWWSPA